MNLYNEARPASRADAACSILLRHFLCPLLAAVIMMAAIPTDAATGNSLAAPSPIASYEILKNFIYWAGRPEAGLLEVSDGENLSFFGTASESDQGNGSVFRISSDGNGGFRTTTLHGFNGSDGRTPLAPLVQGPGNVLYGTTFYGGDSDNGTIFEVSQDGADFATLYSFSGTGDGGNPKSGLLMGEDGSYYGTTSGEASGYGTIFKLSAEGTFETIYTFPGFGSAAPQASLIWGTDGKLYGTTGSGGDSDLGTIFRISTDGNDFETIYSFTGDAWAPTGPLFVGASGNLYGTTMFSGAGLGAVFSVSQNGTGFTILHDFAGTPDDGTSPLGGVIQATDGNLYGTTSYGGASNNGCIFRMTVSGTDFTILHSFDGDNGLYPAAGVIEGSDGSLYGTTDGGGPSSNGTVYRLAAGASALQRMSSIQLIEAFQLLETFPTGTEPAAALIRGGDGRFYGTTSSGNPPFGQIFRLESDGKAFTILHTFDGDDGRSPSGLTQGSDGAFYGTTLHGGGPDDCGNIFKISADGTGFTVLHTFDGSNGCSPQVPLVEAGEGVFFGTTGIGTIVDPYGTIFKLSRDGESWALLKVHSFGDTDGAYPNGLTLGSDGKIYGTTNGGGTNGGGTLFSIGTDGNGFSSIHSFDPSDPYTCWVPQGVLTEGTLAEGKEGWFYGTTQQGGETNSGTIFKIFRDGSGLVVLHSFSAGEGLLPDSGLIRAGGALYGTTETGGASGYGTVFRLASETNFTTLHDFSGPPDGSNPIAPLLFSDGVFYGTTYNGGSADYGTIFRFGLPNSPRPSVSAAAGGPTTFCADASVVLTATPTGGTEPYTYQWYKDASAIDGETGSTYTATESGSFTVTVTDAVANTSDPSTPVTVTVNPLPEATVTPGGSTTFCAGGSVMLTASAGSSWLWSTAETTQSITVSTGGDYTVRVTDANGCSATSGATTVTVHPLPTATITPAGSATLCAGGSIVLTASAGSSWLWSTAQTTQSITVTGGGSYTVTVTDANGCEATSAATTVTVNAPVATVSGSATLCPRGSTTIQAALTGTPPWSVRWSDGVVQTGITSSPATRTVSPRATTTYSVIDFSDATCTGAAEGSAVVTIAAAPKAIVSGSTSICPGGHSDLSVVLTGTAPWTLTWSDGEVQSGVGASPAVRTVSPSTTTVYSLTSVSDAGCGAGTSKGSARVKVEPLPSATITAPTQICASSTRNTATAANAGAGATYDWTITNGTIVSGQGTRTIRFTPSGSGSVLLHVSVTSATGCAASGDATVTVNTGC